MDGVSGVLSDRVAGRIRLRARPHPAAAGARAGDPPYGAAGDGGVSVAGDAGPAMEAGGRRRPGVGDFDGIDGGVGTAVFSPGRDEPAGAELVRARGGERAAVPPLRAVERRCAGGVDGLSVLDRAENGHAHAGLDLVRRVRGVRDSVRGGGVGAEAGAQPADSGRGAGNRAAAGVGRVGGGRLGDAAGDHQSAYRECRGGSVSVDSSAGVVFDDVHFVLRGKTILSPRVWFCG